MHLYLGMMTSTRCPLFWMERPSPATTSPKPPTLATGAISLAICTTWYLGLKWRIVSNSIRIRISQYSSKVGYLYTVLLIFITIYSSCVPAADFSAEPQKSRAQLEREYNDFMFEWVSTSPLPLVFPESQASQQQDSPLVSQGWRGKVLGSGVQLWSLRHCSPSSAAIISSAIHNQLMWALKFELQYLLPTKFILAGSGDSQ